VSFFDGLVSASGKSSNAFVRAVLGGMEEAGS
jgi:hypothetical protein